jgi:hypothetical protein
MYSISAARSAGEFSLICLPFVHHEKESLSFCPFVDKEKHGSYPFANGLVLDLVTQVRDVVFVKCIFSFGKPQGVGISE